MTTQGTQPTHEAKVNPASKSAYPESATTRVRQLARIAVPVLSLGFSAAIVLTPHRQNVPVESRHAPNGKLVAECRDHDSCVWLTGMLSAPGDPDPGPDVCERIDPASGGIAEAWLAEERFHVFWNEAFFHSRFFESCDAGFW